MIPFLYPLALLALASLPALTAIYMFRNRFRRRQVSSLMLWRFGIQTKLGGAKVHRLQLPLIFFLELLAMLLLVVAASGPQWKLVQSARPLIVILDDSLSMRAVEGKRSAQDRARDFLEELFRRQPPPSTRFVLAGSEPRLLGASARSWSEIRPLLDQWNCWSPTAALDAAVTLASEISQQQANILVLTDHRPEDETFASDRLRWHSFGGPLENAAFVNASRAVHGDEDRCLLEIANLSNGPRTTRLLVQLGSNVLEASQIALGPRERKRFVFSVPASAPVLQAALHADPLVEDNHIQLLPPVRKRVRVQVALTNSALNELVHRTLDVTSLRAAISANPELVIHQSDAVPAGSNAWSLRWVEAAGATAYTGPFVIDAAHPAAQGMALQGVIWAAAAITNAPADVPLILAGNVPLLSAREDALGRRHLTLNLNGGLSTLHNTPDWPILFWNLLQWRAAEMPGLLDCNVRLGAEVTLRTTGEPVFVIWPDGTAKAFPKTADQLALETPMPGLYTVSTGPATNSFVVNPLTPDESDLCACASGTWGQWREDPGRRFEESSVLWAVALAALAVMTVHLVLLARGKGGG